MKPGRNDPCPCGSGKKYKQCCGNAAQAPQPTVSAAAEPSNNEKNHLVALYQAGRHAEVERGASGLAQRYPQCGFLWKILAAAQQGQGKDNFAAYEQAARYLPQDAKVLNNLGDLFFKQGRYSEAENLFRRALQIHPNFPDALFNLGQTLQSLVRYKEAEAVYLQAAALEPGNPQSYCRLGELVGSLLHQLDKARAYFESALQRAPNFADAYTGLGRNHLEAGDVAAAMPYFKKALEIQPDSVLALYWLVSNQSVKTGDEYFAALLRIKKDMESRRLVLSDEHAAYFHMAIGKCYDQTGDVQQAMVHYLSGSRIRRSRIRYNPENDTAGIDALIRIFDADFVERLRGAGNLSDKPIFVVGMPRSGTTLTEQIVAAHSKVHGAGELSDVLRITTQPLAGTAYPQSLSHLDQAALTAWGDDYLQAISQIAPDAEHVSDKMPHNFTAVGLIHLMLPNAKIIHIKRHPVDTCISCFTTMFLGDGLPWSYDLAELGRHYRDYTRLMAHWKRVLPDGAFLEVQYEDLVRDTEAQARRIIEYCGLDWEAGCLEFYKNKRVVGTASMTQATRPIYKSSVERWRKYAPYLGPLLAELGDLVPESTEVPAGVL